PGRGDDHGSVHGPGPGEGALRPGRDADQPGRAVDDLQPDRPARHGGRGARPRAAVGKEAPATSDVVTPEPGELAAQDTGRSLVRHTAVMSVGTTLSRLTGFLRLSAMTWAIGVTATTLQPVQRREHHTDQHRR